MAADDVRSRIAHLYRRAGFGARPEELDAAAAEGYEATVERLVEGARPGPDPGGDAVAAPSTEDRRILIEWWVDRMVATSRPLRERLALFWHGHFATSIQKVKEPALMLAQNALFRERGAGPFEALAQAVAKDPAMLLWLDSNQNRKESPNENFAREFFELFTLGIGNYTETDIREAARAFTGWQYRRATGAFTVAAAQHDTGPKTVFGQTGNFGGEDVVRLACAHPACGPHVTAQLWSHFARPVAPNDPVVRELAGPGDVADVLRRMFVHPQFSAAASRTGLVKEPIAYVAGALRALGLRSRWPGFNVGSTLSALGQIPFAPPSVGGWPQNGYWLTTSFALARLRFASAAASRAPLRDVAAAQPADRPAAAARLLGVDGWGPATAKALAGAADDPKALMTLALVAPEYVLA